MEKKIRDLVDRLNLYTEAYDSGNPVISDEKWDDLYFLLVGLEKETGIYLPDSPTQVVKYQVVNELEKVKHNHPMLSLDKTKDWNSFVRYFGDKDVVGMLKLDGLTCSLHYIDGHLVGAETRGDSEKGIGENILHNALVVKSIPNRISFTEELIIDGEIICTDKNFDSFKGQYANSRNFASGSIRLLDSAECAKRNLDFVAWHLVKGPWDTVIESFNFLDSLGFLVSPWTRGFDWDAKEFLVDRAKEEGYRIDGLVGRFNDVAYGESLGSTGHHTKAAYAFKFKDETQTSYLKNIEWSMGRTGVLTPVAIFEPIEIKDTMVERASLHNISILKEVMGTPYIGQTVEILKANEIIPQVASAGIPESKADIEGLVLDVPTKCPICGGDTVVKCELFSELLYCTNSDCEGKLINRLDHFVGKKGLDIKGLSKATLEKLIEWEWVSKLGDIFKLEQYRAEWMEKPGFGEKSVERILSSIESAKSTTLDSFIASLGIPLIGRRMAKELVKHISSYCEFREKATEKFDFSEYPNFADGKTTAIWNYNFTEADEVFPYLTIVNNTEEEKSNSCEGITVVITGTLKEFKNRDSFKEIIENHGGKVVNTISSKTTCLVNNNLESTSSKNKKAKELGIPILSEQDFIQTYLT